MRVLQLAESATEIDRQAPKNECHIREDIVVVAKQAFETMPQGTPTASHIRRLTHILQMLTKWASSMPVRLEESLLRLSLGAGNDPDQLCLSYRTLALEYAQGIWSNPSSASHRHDVVQLTTLLEAFASTVLPHMLDGLVRRMQEAVGTTEHDRHQDGVMMLVLSSTLVLRKEDSRCPPLVKIGPALGRALHGFVRWLGRCTMTASQTDSMITMVSSCLMKCDPRRLLDVVPAAMVGDLLITAVAAYERLLFPRSLARPIPRFSAANLMYMVMFRINLAQITQPAAAATKAALILQDTAPVAHLAAKLAFVALAGVEDGPMPPNFIQLLFDNVQLMAVPTRATAMPTRFRTATIVRCLHECSVRFPACATCCTRVIEGLLPGKLAGESTPSDHISEDDLAALQCMHNHCVSRTSSWIKTGNGNANNLHLLAIISNTLVSVVNHLGGERTGGLHNGLTLPGSLIALEALLRDVQLRGPVMHMWMLMSSVRAAFTVTDFVMTLPVVSAATQRALLSLNSTLLKLMRFMMGLEPSVLAVDTERLAGHLLGILASVSSTAVKLGHRAADKHAHRLYILLCMVVPPVVLRLNQVHMTVRGEAYVVSAVLRALLEDLAPGFQLRYSDRHSGELLCFCSNVECRSLQGMSDATLRTRLCGGCRRATYCSVACQKEHWLAGGHARTCGRVAKG